MELKQLQCFVQICREHSITKAAQSLFLSRQALSKIISNLEAEAGVPLFIRRTDGVELTPSGKLLLERSEQLLQQADQMLQEVRQTGDSNPCELRIGICHLLLSMLDSQIFSEFRRRFPHCTLKLEAMTIEECFQALQEGRLDGVCTAAKPDETVFPPKEFHLALLSPSSPMLLAISDRNPLSGKTDLTFLDLKDETFLFLILPQVEHMSAYFQNLCLEHGFSPKCEAVSTSHWLLADRVAHNDGVHFLPPLVRPCFEIPGVILRTLPDAQPSPEIYFLSTASPSVSTPSLILFERYLCEFLA